MRLILKISILILFLFLNVSPSFGQVKDSVQTSKKHNFTFHWGYNRSAYTKSDLRMIGVGYDYTLQNVVAHDRPSQFDPKIYFNLFKLSIPQFNIRVGYQINDKWCVSLGYDHMKYVVDEYQIANITGTIDSSASAKYAGVYDNEPIKLDDRDFLHFEHTDGLNYITADVDYVSKFWTSKNNKFNLEHRGGAGFGALYPRTDVNIFGTENANIFNLAGVGLSLHSQIRFNLWKFLYIQGSIKSGGIWLPHITTSGFNGDYAKQSFLFVEGFWVIGFRFGFGKN